MPTPEPGAGEQPTAPGRADSGSPAERLWWFGDARRPLPTRTSYRLGWPRRGHTLDFLACVVLSTLCFSQARHELQRHTRLRDPPGTRARPRSRQR